MIFPCWETPIHKVDFKASRFYSSTPLMMYTIRGPCPTNQTLYLSETKQYFSFSSIEPIE